MCVEGRENGNLGKMSHKSLNDPGATSIFDLGRLGKIREDDNRSYFPPIATPPVGI